ncbi:MAG: GNAT family N-acetyltransferase [Candidatus Micrarchaeota archaeon]|nr:GNAT family N-acetyltransferase [Candidatus Micrarchaeota archaeon]
MQREIVVTPKVSLVEANNKKDLATVLMFNSLLGSRTHVGFRDENDMYDVKNKGTIFLIKAGEETVGTVSLMSDGKEGTALVRNLEVLQERQGRGIGTESVYLLLDVMRERGFKKAMLRVRPGNKRARHVYKKVGFEEIGKDNSVGDGVERLVMEKRL